MIGTQPALGLEGAIEQIFRAGIALTTRALSEAVQATDITLSQWRALRIVGDGPNGATVTEVATRVGVTLPATSRLLRRLARRGLLKIRPDERDRRASRATLTPDGRELRGAILDYRRRAIRETCAGLQLSPATVDDLAALADALDRYR